MRTIALLCLSFLTAPAWAEPLPARLDWSQRVELGTPLSGVVAEVAVAPGDTVTEGQLLARLDERRLKADIAGAEAQVKRLRLAYEEAQREYERNQELYDRTVISARDLQLAEIAYAMAEAEYVEARARLTRLKVDLEDGRLRAPFDAIVISRSVNAGETVSNALEAKPMIVVAARDRMLARGWLAETQLAGLETGREVAVQVDGQRYRGRIERLGLEAREIDGTERFEIIVGFQPSTDGILRAGQSADIELP